MQTYDSRYDTLAHIDEVAGNLRVFCDELVRRAVIHDRSKLESPEKEVFDVVTPKLRALTYGSDEYKASLAEMGEALKHHYANNSHHPEHYPEGIRGFDLLDLVEMFCDWCAATMRHEDGDIMKSIENNQARFNYSDDVREIFQNTAKRLSMGKNA